MAVELVTLCWARRVVLAASKTAAYGWERKEEAFREQRNDVYVRGSSMSLQNPGFRVILGKLKV